MGREEVDGCVRLVDALVVLLAQPTDEPLLGGALLAS